MREPAPDPQERTDPNHRTESEARPDDGSVDERSATKQTLDHVVHPQIYSILDSWREPRDVVEWLRELSIEIESDALDEDRPDLLVIDRDSLTRLVALSRARVDHDLADANHRAELVEERRSYTIDEARRSIDAGRDALIGGPNDRDKLAIETDGGAVLPRPIDWPYGAVVHGADLHRDCLALTGSGKPCSYQAYSGEHLCGTHTDASDPEIVPGAHQWARIQDGEVTIAVCVNCEAVWEGGAPPTAVDCPVCDADAGQRCWNDTSVAGKAAPFPPHPERRELAVEVLDDFWPCLAAPVSIVDDEPLDQLDDNDDEDWSYWACPMCEHPIAEWTDCPECGWYDKEIWRLTLDPDSPRVISDGGSDRRRRHTQPARSQPDPNREDDRLPGFPHAVLDDLIEAAADRYEEKLEEHGPGKNWLPGDPWYHRWRVTVNVTEGEELALKNAADALNHLLFALEIDRVEAFIGGEVRTDDDDNPVTDGGTPEPFQRAHDLAIGDIFRGVPESLPERILESLEEEGIEVPDDLSPHLGGVRGGLWREDVGPVIATVLERVDRPVEITARPSDPEGHHWEVEWDRVKGEPDLRPDGGQIVEDAQKGSVWLDCPACKRRGTILAEGVLRCVACGETFDPEEVE